MTDQLSPVVPRLRFPEFRDAPGWRLKEIGPFLQECSERVGPATKMPVYTSSRLGLKPQEAYYAGSRVRNAGEYGVVQPGCIVYRHMSDDGVFAFNLNTTGNPIAVSKEYPVFRCVGIDTRFLLSKLNHSPDFKAFALEQKAGGTRTRLYLSRLRLWVTPLPSLPEQQKVAECLGSLDDLIAAESRKAEALTQHKQGLMAQLFPQGDESVPRLRFPEFQNAGDWEMKTIGDIFETSAGGTPERSKVEYWNGEIPWVTTSLIDFNVINRAEEFISKEGLENSSAKIFPKDTVLLALIGQGKTRGKVALLNFEASTNQNCAGILPSDAVIPNFTFQNLCGRYEELRALSNTAGQGSLSQGLIRTLPFSAPKEKAEQQRIAACLSALDASVAAQTRRLHALKRHKQGLLQQLFPSLGDAR